MSKNRAIDHLNDWSTPKKEFDEWSKKYDFDAFDPCPINGNILGINGLKIHWPRRTFVNPPYELKAKTAFVQKAIADHATCCFLIPVSTSTRFFHELIKPNGEIIFLKGRLKFEGVNTKGQWVNPGTGRRSHPATDQGLEQVNACGMHDSMLVFFGDW
jgi:hypothetical protein